jgi:2-dehydro-3-deoxy-L-rhamnonate aldolase
MKIQNTFRQKLIHNQVQYGLWLSTTSAYVAEIAATSNYDWCLIDGEHAPNTIQNIYNQLQALAPYPIQPVVRLVEGTEANIKQALDIGCQTLLIPLINTAEQAKKIVQATHYPPNGTRGVGAFIARASRWGKVQNYMESADESICLLIQVETRQAVENIDEILQVEGIHGVFIGASDLCASLGYPDQPENEEVQKVIKECIDKIIKSGKAPGFIATNPQIAKKMMEWGVTFIAVGVDVMLYTQALDERINLFKPPSPSELKKIGY